MSHRFSSPRPIVALGLIFALVGVASLASAGIAFVVLDTRTASPDLIHYVQSGIALQRIGEQDGRIFYEVFQATSPRFVGWRCRRSRRRRLESGETAPTPGSCGYTTDSQGCWMA